MSLFRKIFTKMWNKCPPEAYTQICFTAAVVVAAV